jgi:ubiquinone/menaquinone biosynthesis C-methylase UbiE
MGHNENNVDNIYTNPVVVKEYGISREIPECILDEYAAKLALATEIGGKIIDIGCGTGTVLASLAKKWHPRVVYGIDSSEEMIWVTKKRMQEKWIQNTYLIDVDFVTEYSHYAKYKFDVTHLKAITHIPETPELLLRQVIHVTKKGGKIVLGKEWSQPEDNLERIWKYTENTNPELEEFYREYFKLRDEIWKPFQTPQMPAWDYENAKWYLESMWIVFDTRERVTSIWQKGLKIGDLIKAIRIGTFTVMRKWLTEWERNNLAKNMESFCQQKNIDIEEEKTFPAQLRMIVGKKPFTL